MKRIFLGTTEEEIRKDRELTQAVLAHSRRVMSEIIARNL